MSRLADQIRELVADPSVSDHYGEWGILHPTQRKMIRKLCAICDIYEQEADRANMEIEWLEKHNARMANKHYADGIKAFAERLCEGRVSNDPVVIAAKCLLKEMTEKGKRNERKEFAPLPVLWWRGRNEKRDCVAG